MNRMQRAAVLLTLLQELHDRGSWCGETHLQKATYFLQALMPVPLEFEFILFKHGPYSFDLNDEITALRADSLLAIESRGPYGPNLLPGSGAATLLKRFAPTIRRYRDAIAFVAKRLGPKDISELEKLATALFVTLEEPSYDTTDRALRINELKPHIQLDEARAAVQTVEGIVTDARAL